MNSPVEGPARFRSGRNNGPVPFDLRTLRSSAIGDKFAHKGLTGASARRNLKGLAIEVEGRRPDIIHSIRNREADMTASVHPPAGGVHKPEGEAAREDRAFAGRTPEEHQDRLLDEGIEETFPASDPVSVPRVRD